MSFVCLLRDQSDGGCWVAYGLDHSQHYSTAVFPDELSARRHAMDNYLTVGTVGFLRWGELLVWASPSPACRADEIARDEETA